MENWNSMQELVEKYGEETQMDMIANRSLQLALSINEYKKANIKEDYQNYVETYNNVCEKIADMKLMLEQAEFLFNTNTINDHYSNKLELMKK